MPEISENLEAEFLDEPTDVVSNSLEPIYIHTLQTLPGLSPVAKCIMDELKDRHRRIAKQSVKDIHPSYLLTLDKLSESLQKYTNLSVQARTEQAIDVALRQILDLDGRGENRIAYLYPFLIRDGNKIVSKIALIAPQSGDKTDIRPYREACFRESTELVNLILSNRAKKPRTVDEENPGQFLIHPSKKEPLWLYPKFGSLESEIISLLKKGFPPYSYIPIQDFIDDFISYGMSTNALIQVLSDFHLIIDELDLTETGEYRKIPELITNYRAQADGLEKFSMHYLKNFAQEANFSFYLTKLNDFEIKYIQGAEPGRRQNHEKVVYLLDLIREFPFETSQTDLARRVSETCLLSVKILDKLIIEKESLIHRRSEFAYKVLEESLLKKITDYTKEELKLFNINLEEEIRKIGIKSEIEIDTFQKKLKEKIVSEFGTHEASSENGQKVFYVVDQGYMASVINKLTSLTSVDKRYKNQLEIARKINAKMSNPKNPRLNSSLKPDVLMRLLEDSRRMEKFEEEKIRKAEFAKKFNLVAGIFSFIFSFTFFMTVSFTFDSIQSAIIGIPASLIIAVLSSIFFKKKESMEDTQSRELKGQDTPEENSVVSGDKKNLKEKEDKLSIISKAAENFIFGGKFNKISDKIFDLKSIRKKIEYHLTDIQSSVPILAKETDRAKVSSSIEYAVLQNSVVIAIPEDIVPRNKPNSILFSKNDFKAPLIRQEIAEYYRAEAEKSRHDTELVRYYKFLINTLEVEYYKYLPKKVR
ncbi:MAG: hypothetical protein L6Q54_14495 [Leptospiraceae bacterium]|nr:hypothetical protein [Leptospiraceae bacterium]MCK6382442.1 hypothetical protein [Leptospiraceae bacterium]NUM41397.1 hypothetical protein [Leptospiraceae bacterium]